MNLMFHDPNPKPIALESSVLDYDIIEQKLTDLGYEPQTYGQLFEQIKSPQAWKPVDRPDLWGKYAPADGAPAADFEVPDIPQPTGDGPYTNLTRVNDRKRAREAGDDDDDTCKRQCS